MQITHKVTIRLGEANQPIPQQLMELLLTEIHQHHTECPVALAFPDHEGILSLGNTVVLYSTEANLTTVLEKPLLKSILQDNAAPYETTPVFIRASTTWTRYSRIRLNDHVKPSAIRRLLRNPPAKIGPDSLNAKILRDAKAGMNPEEISAKLKRIEPVASVALYSRSTNSRFLMGIKIESGDGPGDANFDVYGLSHTAAVPN